MYQIILCLCLRTRKNVGIRLDRFKVSFYKHWCIDTSFCEYFDYKFSVNGHIIHIIHIFRAKQTWIPPCSQDSTVSLNSMYSLPSVSSTHILNSYAVDNIHTKHIRGAYHESYIITIFPFLGGIWVKPTKVVRSRPWPNTKRKPCKKLFCIWLKGTILYIQQSL